MNNDIQAISKRPLGIRLLACKHRIMLRKIALTLFLCLMFLALCATKCPESGAEWNPTGNPVGGGPGYSDSVRHQDADYYVTNKTELLSALSLASSGDIVYIADTVEIDLSSEVPQILIPGGVTLASGRGRFVGDTISWGGLLYITRHDIPLSLFRTYGNGVRITGLRLKGADPDIGQVCSPRVFELLRAISIFNEDCEIDNCEIYEWGYAGVVAGDGAIGAHIHHNYIHHNRRKGCGYGVVTGDSADVLIEANLFDFYRHAIAASGEPNNSYEARYNICMEHGVLYSAFDRHGTGGSVNYAGQRTYIHHNVFRCRTTAYNKAVAISGFPDDSAVISNNWCYHSDSASAFGLYTNEHCSVYDNHFGTTPPVGASGRLPIAVAHASVDSGKAPLTVSFTSAASYDPDGYLTWCEWDFGGGITARKATIDHTFENIGIYNVQLTVIDNTGIPATDIIPIVVTPATPDSHYMSFWVKDSYRSNAYPDYFYLQVYIDTAKIWQQDVVGDAGWIHVVQNVMDHVAGRDSVTVKLRLYCNRDIDAGQYLHLFSYWDDIVLFWAGIENGDFEAQNRGYNQNPDYWKCSHHSSAGGYWGGENRSGDVRSGKQSFWLLMTDGGINKAGDWIQIEQKVPIGLLSVPRSSRETKMFYVVYPNPTMRTAMITYQVQCQSNIFMKMYDTNGRLVKTLMDEEQETGFYQVNWDGTDENSRDVANGVYFCKLIAQPIDGGEEYSETKKVVFLR